MDEQKNVELIQKAYESFGRGDIDALLETMSDDISWEPIIGAGKHVPHAGLRRGKQDVREFFRILADTLTFDQFEPQEFISQGDKVVVLGRYTGRPKSTGRTIASDWVMIFTVRDGKVTAFREFTDSAAINASYDQAAAAKA